MSNKPLANPNAFTGVAPPWSLTQLDANFTAIQNTINDTLTYDNYFVDQSGVVNSIVVSIPSTLTVALTAGTRLSIKIANTNTSAVTITVNALAAQSVVNGDLSAMSPGQLPLGSIAVFEYDGTRFQHLGSGITQPYLKTTAEAGLTIVNFFYRPGHILRYGTNTTPGTTDMTAAFATLALTGYVGYAPAQDYLISSAVTWAVNFSGLVGDGMGTRILTNSAGADIFVVGNGTTQISGMTFANLRIWTTIQKTAGSCFNCRMIARSIFLNVHAGSLDDYTTAGNIFLLWNGYIFNQFSVIDVLGGEVLYSNNGIQINGSSTGTFGAEITLTDGLYINGGVGVNTKAVYLSGGSGGVYIDRCSISLCGGYGVYCDVTSSSTTYPNRELIFGAGCTIDTCTNWGLYLTGNSVALLEANGLWVAGCGTVATSVGGINVQPLVSGTVPSLKLSGCQIYNNFYDGLQLNDCTALITACEIRNNGTGTPGGHGIHIPDVATTPFVISGCFIHNNGNSTRGYAINITSGSQTNFNITGNTLTANGQGGATGQINDPAANTTAAIVRNNVGYVTEKSGSATITNGTSSVVVSHGLATTPSFVAATFSSAPDANLQVYVASADFTTTQFTIRVSASVGADRSFFWRAVIGTQ
jgi:hypothetical protein